MLSGWIFVVYLITHGYTINASFNEKETKYFVNKEIYDETRKIDDKLQRLKIFNGKRKSACTSIYLICLDLDFKTNSNISYNIHTKNVKTYSANLAKRNNP